MQKIELRLFFSYSRHDDVIISSPPRIGNSTTSRTRQQRIPLLLLPPLPPRALPQTHRALVIMTSSHLSHLFLRFKLPLRFARPFPWGRFTQALRFSRSQTRLPQQPFSPPIQSPHPTPQRPTLLFRHHYVIIIIIIISAVRA